MMGEAPEKLDVKILQMVRLIKNNEEKRHKERKMRAGNHDNTNIISRRI